MSMLKVGDKVITVKDNSGYYLKGWFGFVKETDNSSMPYLIKFENGRASWVYSDDVKLSNSHKQAEIIERVTKLLDKCLEDGLGVTKVTIEFDTDLIVTLNEKE